MTITGMAFLATILNGGIVVAVERAPTHPGETKTEPAEDLNGATGRIFNVDLSGKSFELLKETVYDAKTGEGRSRHTVYWTDATVIAKVVEKKGFDGIKAPVIADFHDIDDANAKALKEGRHFVARVAVVLPEVEKATGWDESSRRIVSWFTPDAGASPRSGTIQVKGRPVKVSLSRRRSRICVHTNLSAADLARGFWKTMIQGRRIDGAFVADRLEVCPIVDPRTVDDPRLPRVLVVGDSISMNYEKAARDALKGIANYHRNEGNCFSTCHGIAFMEYWMGDHTRKGLHWDVIQFNHGLHDLKQPSAEAPYAVPIEVYKKNLKKEIEIAKKSGATLIWCSTTPVPNSSGGKYGRQKGAEKEFNKAALEVMRQYPEIQINDLCKVVNDSSVFDNWRRGSDVHFYKAEEQALLGKAVAAAVIKALAARKAVADKE